ncbi:MAG: hypothetical protein K5857_00550 [Lachnospiraceae bacterium]|nr:hypothetical protein [Lachnospiraceae bacterium]
MSRFICDGSFRDDMNACTDRVLERYGIASGSAHREVMLLANEGNTVALKLYADMIFYKRILRKNAYRDGFMLYLKSAGITIEEDGTWTACRKAYPLAYWALAFCLVNYRRGSFLLESEPIDIIDKMSLDKRLSLALELACASLDHTKIPGAINLIGRILSEAADDPGLYDAMKDVIKECVSVDNRASLKEKAGDYFKDAAREGYVYAANNLAAAEADRISEIMEKAEDEDVRPLIERYIEYLKMSADRYEPYAANRLGLLYMTGEIRGREGNSFHRSYVNPTLAKEYFNKATVCPDANSAWAFFNLIKYFHKDYDNDIEHMNEHMDYIRELNPAVYDLAMEL